MKWIKIFSPCLLAIIIAPCITYFAGVENILLAFLIGMGMGGIGFLGSLILYYKYR